METILNLSTNQAVRYSTGAYRIPESIFNPLLFDGLIIRLRSLDPKAIPLWGKMNVLEMLSHLNMATASGLGHYQLQDESTWLRRNVICYLALYVLRQLPRNAAAPKGFSIAAAGNLNFEREMGSLLRVLNMASCSENQSYPHPLFGNMNKADWGRLVYRHIDHHLRQFSN